MRTVRPTTLRLRIASRTASTRVGKYLVAGDPARLGDPEQATAVVFRSLTDVRRVERDGVLDGEDVVRGFTCSLAELLA